MRKAKVVGFAHLLKRAIRFSVLTGIDVNSDDFVSTIADTLGVGKDEVTAAMKAEKIDDLKALVTKSKTGKVIYTADDFTKFKDNYRTDIVADIAAQAKAGKAPKEIYDPIKGAALEMVEKDLAKKYSIQAWNNMEDLADKIRGLGNPNPTEVEKQLREAQTKIADLQGVNVSLLDKVRIAEESAGKAKSDVEIKYTTAGALNAVQFDVAAEQQSKQRDILKSLVDGRYEIKTEGDKIIAVDRTTGKKAVNDATLEPLSLEGVFIAVAKEYGLPVKSPAADGRGSGSSSAATGIAAMTEVEFNEHLRKINKWGTIEGDKLYKEWKEAHKTN